PWPASLPVVAVAALAGGRPKLALALLGVAAAAKLYAVLLVPVALAWLWRERRAVVGPFVSFCAAAAVLVVPWFALSPGGVWDSVHSQVGRALHTESLGAGVLLAADRLGWYHAHVVKAAPAVSRDLAGGLPDTFATVSAVLAVAAALLPAFVLLRRRAGLEASPAK